MFVSQIEHAVVGGVHDQGANVTLDKHAVDGADETLAAVDAAPEAFADRTDVKTMGTCHGVPGTVGGMVDALSAYALKTKKRRFPHAGRIAVPSAVRVRGNVAWVYGKSGYRPPPELPLEPL